jgi:hypothetical protein
MAAAGRLIGPSVAGSSEGVTSDPKSTPVWTRADISRALPAEIPATIEALCRTRTGDPFLTMEVLMDPDDRALDEQAVKDADEAREFRARRDAALTPEARLERVAELCRQLALIRPAEPR